MSGESNTIHSLSSVFPATSPSRSTFPSPPKNTAHPAAPPFTPGTENKTCVPVTISLPTPLPLAQLHHKITGIRERSAHLSSFDQLSAHPRMQSQRHLIRIELKCGGFRERFEYWEEDTGWRGVGCDAWGDGEALPGVRFPDYRSAFSCAATGPPE
ncbi:hypothetical protein NMY22_g9398 [Coprinellus aureogranulatus]|nr:hypothetical protein NMY22_g9398 [Coprinellus aureogranulatus]